MIHYIHGNLLDSGCNYICHQVNCRGAMNSGVAKQIRNVWPEVYKAYYGKYEETIRLNFAASSMLSDIQIVALHEDYNLTTNHQHVINMFSQADYGYDGKCYTSYDAFWNCLVKIRQCCPDTATFAFPYKIASDRGGANWNVIRTMIEEVLYDREVFIYYLSEVDLTPEDRKILIK